MKRLRLPTVGPTARTVALRVLLECHAQEAFVQEVLDAHLSATPLSPADRRLATQLAYGVLRRRGTLDALIRTAVTRRRDQVEEWLWEAIRLGLYQLLLLSQIPRHAAIFETVDLANTVGNPRGKGFLNAVLRKLATLVTDTWTNAPAADAVPFEDGRYRLLTARVLPDPDTDPAGYLVAAFSWPRWLTERWLERYGRDECLRLGFWFAGQAPIYLRVNRLKTDRDRMLKALADLGVRAEPGTYEHSVRLIDHAPIPLLPGYADGWFAVQDESAMRVAAAVEPQPGMRVLDLCAAPGGKTTHLAELMNDEGQVLACDADPFRLETVAELAGRLGLNSVETHPLDAERDEEPPPGPFDAALADVPCSNTGVLGRRPEVRWRVRPGDLPHLIPLQTKLLLQAAERVRPGGAVVYSTCSVEPDENQNVVRVVLRALRDFSLEAEASQSPGRPADGGYWARLRRKPS